MIHKLVVAFVVMALAMFSVAACGGDDDDEPIPPDPVEEPAEGPDDEPLGEGGTLEIEADPGGALEYTTGALTVESGEVTIEFDNPASLPHDVRIESGDGDDLGGTAVITDDSDTATVTLEPGEYSYYCSVAGHREGGMEDILTVE
jgi:plastocyanin